jgi:hypothetical protein
VLEPLLFLVFINDIADGMTGLGRLFADGLSICLVHLQSLLKITLNVYVIQHLLMKYTQSQN